MTDFPDLSDLQRIPSDGATAEELAAELARAPLLPQLAACDAARFEAAIRAVNRAGLAHVAVALVLARRAAAKRWETRPDALAGEVLELDPAKLTRAALAELTRRGWLEHAGSRYRLAAALRNSEDVP